MEGQLLPCLSADVPTGALQVELDQDSLAPRELTGDDEAQVTARLEDLGYL